MNNLIDREITNIIKDYKISKQGALNLFIEKLEKNIKLKSLIATEKNLEKIEKTRIYKDFVKNLRKEIYYSLRKYLIDDETFEKQFKILEKAVKENNLNKYTQLFSWFAQNHTSTKERFDFSDEFNDNLIKYLENSASIIDIGGGMFPLTFPFNKIPNLKKYAWIDKDNKSFKVVELFSKTITTPELFLSNRPLENSEVDLKTDVIYDTVLILKTIPVIYRQQKSLINLLANLPSKRFIITGSKVAMTKNQDIERRERKVIQNFINLTSKKILEKFEIENEFGYVLG